MVKPIESRNVVSQILARIFTFSSNCLAGRDRVRLYPLALVIGVGLTFLFSQVLLATNPPPIQTFYVPLPEDQVFDALTAIFPGQDACNRDAPEVQNPINTYLSIAAIADSTIIYYDHWEDGFEVDISNPTQITTQIWGDGDPSNGSPPDFPGDIINAGNIIVLDNPVDTPTRQSVIDFDGGDKFAASKTVAMTRAAWATGPLTLLAGAVEVYDTSNWGTSFEAPVGQDIDSNSMFEHTSLIIMAAEPDTVVEIDADDDGTTKTTVTLTAGESYHVNGGLKAGATVNASAPVQVDMLTGDVCAVYESRWFSLFPTDQWSDSYYSPVGTPSDDPTAVFLYNPGPDSITVEWETAGSGQTATDLLPGETARRDIPPSSGAHFYTMDGHPFMAIATIDADSNTSFTGNATHDWGFALVPEHILTPYVLVGWGPGRDPLSNINPDENSSPVWITPVLPAGVSGSVNICVDFDGDGVGLLIDDNGNQYDDLIENINELESVRVYDPDGDQTGMVLYVCDNSEAKLAAAWGQDPVTASSGTPAIDVGTTIPPLPSFGAGKGVEVANDVDGDGQASPGDILLYTVVIQNISGVPIPDLVVIDTVPLYTEYVPTSTAFDDGITVTAIADDGTGTLFPLDEGGVNLGLMPAGSVFTVTFQVTIDRFLPAGVDHIVNQAIVRAIGEEVKPEVETPLNVEPAIDLIKLAGDAADDHLYFIIEPQMVQYTYLVTNIGDTYLSAITIADDNGTPGLTSDDFTLTATECAGLAGPLAPDDTVTCTYSKWVADDETNIAVTTANPTDQNGNDMPDMDDVTADDDAQMILDEPTAIHLVSFTAEASDEGVTLTWETAVEIDNAGFNLWRSLAAGGTYVKINDKLIAAQGDGVSGANYTYLDTAVAGGVTYYYKLEDVDYYGVSAFHGPVSVETGSTQTSPNGLYLPIIVKE